MGDVSRVFLSEGNAIGTLGVLANTRLELSDGSDASRQQIAAKINGIKTIAEAEAFAAETLGLLQTAQAATPEANSPP